MSDTLEPELVESIFDRISKDLTMILDREFAVGEVAAETADARPAGEGQVHVSFKLAIEGAGGGEGCVLLPLPEAISLAGYLMMVDDGVVEENRSSDALDRPTKEALLEVGNFIAGAADAVFRAAFSGARSVRAAGCQGVRADVRPALAYEEGSQLLVGRARVRIHEFPEFEAILMLPHR